MFLLIEMTNLASVRAFLVGIPEALELFVFGVGLIVTVMLLRWFLDRGNTEKTKEELTNN